MTGEDLNAIELIAVAKAVTTRGIKGEIAAQLLTDFPERFEWIDRLIGVAPSGERRWLDLESHWLHKNRVILKFAGFDTPEAAEQLKGWEFAVRETDAVELEPDEYYDWQLIGCRVETIDNRFVGTVREVLHTGAAPVLVIRDESDKENLVPLAESICIKIDTERKAIRIDPPEGLL